MSTFSSAYPTLRCAGSGPHPSWEAIYGPTECGVRSSVLAISQTTDWGAKPHSGDWEIFQSTLYVHHISLEKNPAVDLCPQLLKILCSFPKLNSLKVFHLFLLFQYPCLLRENHLLNFAFTKCISFWEHWWRPTKTYWLLKTSWIVAPPTW